MSLEIAPPNSNRIPDGTNYQFIALNFPRGRLGTITTTDAF